MGKYDVRLARLERTMRAEDLVEEMVTLWPSCQLQEAMILAEKVLGKPLAELTKAEKGGALRSSALPTMEDGPMPRSIWGRIASAIVKSAFC